VRRPASLRCAQCAIDEHTCRSDVEKMEWGQGGKVRGHDKCVQYVTGPFHHMPTNGYCWRISRGTWHGQCISHVGTIHSPRLTCARTVHSGVMMVYKLRCPVVSPTPTNQWPQPSRAYAHGHRGNQSAVGAVAKPHSG